MRHNLVHYIPLLLVVVRRHLRRQRQLLVVAFGARDDVEVDTGRLAVNDRGSGALLTEVDLRAVDLIHHNSRDGSHDLQGEVLRLDHVDGRDERVDNEGEAVRVLDSDGVSFALDYDGGAVAFADEDRVGDGRFDLDGLRLLFIVFLLQPRVNTDLVPTKWERRKNNKPVSGMQGTTHDSPLVALELFPGRLLSPHALRLGLLARSRALASDGTVVVGNRGSRSQLRVLVRHLGLVHLPEALRHRLALV